MLINYSICHSERLRYSSAGRLFNQKQIIARMLISHSDREGQNLS